MSPSESLLGNTFSYDAGTGAGTVRVDGGRLVDIDATALAAGGLRLLRIGQRVHLQTRDGVVTRVGLPTPQQESTRPTA